MSRIIIYVDLAEIDTTTPERRFSFSGDFIFAGRSSEIADKARRIDMLLQLLLEQMGDDPVIEIRACNKIT